MHTHEHSHGGGRRRGRGWRGRGLGAELGAGVEAGVEAGFEVGGRRRGRGRKRMFDGGELRLVLLKLIADTPRHGYDLIRAIEERTGGAYAPSPGVVYPTLTLLGDMGLIAEREAEGTRKLFEITPDGTQHLAERAEEVDAIMARLDAMAAEEERTDAAPVRRAMHNLRNVLRHRLAEGLDKDKLHEAVALIDEAAGKIERL